MPRGTLHSAPTRARRTTGRLNALKQRMNTELGSVFESQPLTVHRSAAS